MWAEEHPTHSVDDQSSIPLSVETYNKDGHTMTKYTIRQVSVIKLSNQIEF